MLDYDDDSPRIREIAGSLPMRSEKAVMRRDRRQRQHRRHEETEEAKDHFEELAREAQALRYDLVREGSRYRYYVYWKADRVLIDIVVLDDNGQIASVTTRDITHEPFCKWAQNIGGEEGLLLDKTI